MSQLFNSFLIKQVLMAQTLVVVVDLFYRSNTQCKAFVPFGLMAYCMPERGMIRWNLKQKIDMQFTYPDMKWYKLNSRIIYQVYWVNFKKARKTVFIGNSLSSFDCGALDRYVDQSDFLLHDLLRSGVLISFIWIMFLCR